MILSFCQRNLTNYCQMSEKTPEKSVIIYKNKKHLTLVKTGNREL